MKDSNIFAATVGTVMKRPSLLFIIGALTLAAVAVNTFIPIAAIATGLINLTGGDIYGSMLLALQMLMEDGVAVTFGIYLAVAAVIFSVFAGLLIPGIILVVDDGLSKGHKAKGIFAKGIKNNFFRVFFITFKAVLFAVFLIMFLTVATVPAIIVTKAASTFKPDAMIGAVFVDLITVGIIISALFFFRIYVLMWYIAAVKGEKKPFKAGKSAADRRFGNTVVGLLTFDLIFIAAAWFFHIKNDQFIYIVGNWIFMTLFFTALAVYLVKRYRTGSRQTKL